MKLKSLLVPGGIVAAILLVIALIMQFGHPLLRLIRGKQEERETQPLVAYDQDDWQRVSWNPVVVDTKRAGAMAVGGKERDVGEYKPTEYNTSGFSPQQTAAKKLIWDRKPYTFKIRIKPAPGATGDAAKERVYEVPADAAQRVVDLEPDQKAFSKLSVRGIDTFVVSSAQQVRQFAEILFTVDNPIIYPGAWFHGDDFFNDAKFRPVVLPEKFRAPVDLTVLGAQVPPGNEPKKDEIDEQKFGSLLNLPGEKPVSYTVANPQDRQSYENVVSQLRARMTHAANWRQQINYASGTRHMLFQLNAGFSGFGAEVKGGVEKEEDEDNQAVFMVLRRAAFRVAVAKTMPTEAWFSRDVDPVALEAALNQRPGGAANATAPILYCSDMTYGQVICLVGQHSFLSKKLRAELEARYSGATYSANIKLTAEEKETLDKMDFDILVYGGDPKYDKVLPKTLKWDEAVKMIDTLSQNKLTAENALPVAFNVRYLADASEASFVGVHPHRIQKLTPGNGMPITVMLKKVFVDDTHSGFLGFGGEDFGLMVKATNQANPFALRRHFEDKLYDFGTGVNLGSDRIPLETLPNSHLGLHFEARFPEGEDHKGFTWDSLNSWNNPEQSAFDLDVQQVLDDEAAKPTGRNFAREFKVQFPDNNWILLEVRLEPPKLPKFETLPGMAEGTRVKDDKAGPTR